MLRNRCIPGAIVLAGAIATHVHAEAIKFVRDPHIANDGRLTFAYHGDIWVADADGSNARRLTAHIASDSHPRFSPDGTQIAFTSNRMGNDDVWVMSASGSEPRQLTFNTTGDNVQYWMPDGKSILFSTSRGAGQWGTPLHTVGFDGKLPQPLAMDRGSTGMVRQDGSMIAFNRNSMRSWRKGYRGNANTDIDVMSLPSGEIRQLTDLDLQKFREHVQDANPMWGSDGLIYFSSERSGTFNLWKIDPKGGEAIQVTTHTDDGVQNPSISPDGTKIVYENEFELWRIDVPNGQPRKIAITLDFDPKDNFVEWTESTNEADGYTPSPDGEALALDRHGEIFIVPSDRELGEKTQVTSSAWRDRYETWSPDGKTIAYISDESLEEEIWLYDVASKARHKLTTHDSTKDDLTWSPDSKKLAFTAANRLFIADAASGVVTDAGYNEDGGYNLSEFSADGRWLVYSRSNADLNSEVYLFNIEEKREYNVTDDPGSDRGGRLTSDGKTLVFTSSRDGANSALYAVTLQKPTEDPDDPLVRARKKKEAGPSARGGEGSASGGGGGGGGGSGGRPFGRGRRGTPPPENPPAPPPEDQDKPPAEGEGDDEAQKPEEPASKSAETQPDKPLDIKIDVDRIDKRARRLTTGSESVSSYFLSKDGKTVYYVSGPGGEGFGGGRRPPRAEGATEAAPTRSLNSISIEGRDQKKIADGSFAGLTPTADRKYVFFRETNVINRMGISGSRKEPVNFALTVKVDHRAEWEQIFEEAWRVMKYRFYDENMHGRDWAAIKAVYKPMLKYVGENEDVYDLCNEMIGELNASHTGVNGPPTRSIQGGYNTRNLGFEMKPDGEYYRISHIYRDGPADKQWLNLNVGDYVMELDGQPLEAGDNYYEILNHLLNEYVNVKVAAKKPEPGAAVAVAVIAAPQPAESATTTAPATQPAPAPVDPNAPRIVRIRSANSVGEAKYEEWVETSREFVDRESSGRIGYVHIRSMDQRSLERFQNEINQYWNKLGMVIDIRYNGGGNIDQELIDILERKPYEYWNSRWAGKAAGRRPRQAIVGPQVMLINWRSASDSEVTPQAFRDLKLGRIVGNPTNGSVIATGSYSLINGASIRTPGSLVATYDPTKPNNYGINLENFGVAPDVWVENTPHDELKGYDRELKAAVDEAIRMLGEGTWQYAAKEQPAAKPAGGTAASGSQQQQQHE